MITVRPLFSSLFLLITAIILILASILSIYLGTLTIENQFVEIRKNYIRLFDLNREANIPTWFSSLLFMLNAFILAIIAILTKARQGPYYTQWFVLAVIFLYLSIDESALLHEMAEKPVRRAFGVPHGYLYFAWIIPAVCFLIVLGVYIRRFLFELPKNTRWLFLIAGAVFVSGAVGMEAITAKIFSTNAGHKTMAYYFWANLEESFEMFGLIIFFYALLDYVAQNMPEIVFSVKKSG